MTQLTDQNIDWGKWLGSAAVGALVMYMLDPERGGPRRARTGERLREMGQGMGKNTGDAFERVVRSIGDGSSYDSARNDAADVAQRASHAGQQLADRAANTGQQIADRASHAGQQLAERASSAGHQIADRAADVYHSAESSLRGTMHRASDAMEPLLEAGRGPWSTSTRSAAVIGGGALGLYALASRSPLAILAGLAGLTLLTRGASNRPIRQLVKGGHRMIDVERTIHVDASPEKVYELWSNYENFPHFMSNVIEVRDLGNRRSQWLVRGPAGSEYRFNSVLTDQSRGRRLAWRSEPGAEVDQHGSVEFQPSRGGTRVTVRISYVPPAGAIGHGLAALIGSDPEHRMDDDLARMKAVIERGAIPSGAARDGSGLSRFLH